MGNMDTEIRDQIARYALAAGDYEIVKDYILYLERQLNRLEKEGVCETEIALDKQSS